MMKYKLLTISPLRFSLLCGIISAAFSCSSVFLLSQSIFLIPFFLLNYFWLTPILLANLRYGFSYGLIASAPVLGINIIMGDTASLLLFCGTLFPALFLMHLLRTPTLSPRQGVGEAFSRICFVYLGLMCFILVFIFDSHSIKSISTSFLAALSPQEAARISESFSRFFPAIMCVSVLISLAVNTLVTLTILTKIPSNDYPFPQENDFKIPPYWDIVFIVSLLLLLTGNEMFAFIGRNVLLLSCIPIYLYGLGIVCSWLNPFENWMRWLIIAIVLSLVLVWPAMLIILLGLQEPVLKMTKRFK